MAEHQVKSINQTIREEGEITNVKVDHLLTLCKALAQQMSNSNADVRKTVVFCLVEICQAIGMDLFQQEVVETMLNPS
jgi:hypothetical protein